jgi:hypothetical protein
MTALPDRAAPCRAAERPTDILSLCTALALRSQAIEPRLDIGDAKSIKPQDTDSRLDVILHVALIRRVSERGKVWSNGLFEPSMEELPNCRHLRDNGPARGLPSELHPPAVDDLTSSTVDVFALALA